MEKLDKVIMIRARLTRQLAARSGIRSIEIASPAADIRPATTQYVIRIFVDDPDTSSRELGVPRWCEGVPVQIAYRHPSSF